MDPLIAAINACKSERDFINLLTRKGMSHLNAVSFVKRIGVLASEEKSLAVKLVQMREALVV